MWGRYYWTRTAAYGKPACQRRVLAESSHLPTMLGFYMQGEVLFLFLFCFLSEENIWILVLTWSSTVPENTNAFSEDVDKFSAWILQLANRCVYTLPLLQDLPSSTTQHYLLHQTPLFFCKGGKKLFTCPAPVRRCPSTRVWRGDMPLMCPWFHPHR